MMWEANRSEQADIEPMKLFVCPACGAQTPFDSVSCLCGAVSAFDDRRCDFTGEGQRCANADLIGCNWVAASGSDFCRACAMTTMKPDTSTADNRSLWAETERAKRWVLFCLGQWGWFGPGDTGSTPEFHMLSETVSTGATEVTMGHKSGVITINVSEADPATRVFRRQLLGERFRTIIGHLRHEISHFLFMRLVSQSDTFAEEFRGLFGDERQDYGAALERYYASGPSLNWQQTCVTAYASSHPHEDWAESAAHIQHIADIVDSSVATGLSAPSLNGADYRAYAEPSGETLVTLGVEFGLALNHVNRSMGLPDIYPFVLTPRIRDKLVFAHRWLRLQDPKATG